MIENWPIAFGESEIYEGWHKFSNDPVDPGGATMNGVTQGEFNAWLGRQGRPIRPVRSITDGETKSIAKAQYWDAIKGDELPSGLDLLIFDIALNSGPVKGIKFLQQGLGLRPDGQFGLATSGAVSKALRAGQISPLISRICALRMSFWRSLMTFWRFGKGWTARGSAIEAKALLLARGPRV